MAHKLNETSFMATYDKSQAYKKILLILCHNAEKLLFGLAGRRNIESQGVLLSYTYIWAVMPFPSIRGLVQGSSCTESFAIHGLSAFFKIV